MCPQCNKEKDSGTLGNNVRGNASFDYTRRHNEVVRYIFTNLTLKCGLRTSKKIKII